MIQENQKMKQSRPIPRRRNGFALVITLIMITLLAIMALAFLFSSSLDQSTSRGLANKTKANSQPDRR